MSDFEALSQIVNVFYNGDSKCVYINEDNVSNKKEDFTLMQSLLSKGQFSLSVIFMIIVTQKPFSLL